MSYQPGTSRVLDSALRTPAQLRAAFGKLVSSVRVDRSDLDDVTEDVETILAAIRRPAIADEALAVGDAIRIASVDPLEHIEKAQADAVANADADGICTKAANVDGVTEYCPSGVVELAGWGLTAGSIYYLSAGAAGAITTTAPSTVGQVVRIMGVAVSADELLVRIEQGILL